MRILPFPIFFQADFEFLSDDYERQLMRLLTKKEKTGLIINNPSQSMFLFVDRQHLEVDTTMY